MYVRIRIARIRIVVPRAQRERKNGVGRRVGRCGNPSGSRGGSLREPGWVAGWVAAGTRVGRGVGGSRLRFPREPKGPGWVAAGVPAGCERAGAAVAAAVENLPRFGLGSAGLCHHISRLWQSPSRLGHRKRFHPQTSILFNVFYMSCNCVYLFVCG